MHLGGGIRANDDVTARIRPNDKPDAAVATQAAQRLAEAGVELPVFAREPLAQFCRDTDASASAEDLLVRHWLVGIETRQVLCLLDPALVQREREDLDARIGELEVGIETARDQHAASAPLRQAMQQAQQAATALAEGMPGRNASLEEEFAETKDRLPALRKRASDDAVAAIRAALAQREEFPGVSEDDIQQEVKAAAGEKSRLDTARSEADQRRDDPQAKLDAAVQSAADAKAAAGRIPELERIQSFLDTEGALDFMRTADDKRKQLLERHDRAGHRKGFDFKAAQELIDRGPDHPKTLEREIQEVDDEKKNIEEQQIPRASKRTQELKDEQSELARDAEPIDRLINALVTSYKEFRADTEQWEAAPGPVDEEDPLMQLAAGLRAAEPDHARVKILLQFASEFSAERFREGRSNLQDAQQKSEAAEGTFAVAVDGMLNREGLELGAYIR